MAKFANDYIVCSCKNVSLGEIVYAIEQKKAKTIKDIGYITDAGTMCGCCKSPKDDYGKIKKRLYLDTILKKYKKETK
jgi:NAD(P)H-nitrite reductase large subunit